MQELRAEDFSTDEETESSEEDIADDGDKSQMRGWDTEGAQ